jgi:hypothetical protein
MEIDDEFKLTRVQKIQERNVITKCFELMRDERSRYENQANQLIENGILQKDSNEFTLLYYVKNDTYLCRMNNKDKAGDSYEIGFPIPQTVEAKIETLVELFAQSEAGRIA